MTALHVTTTAQGDVYLVMTDDDGKRHESYVEPVIVATGDDEDE